MTLSAAIESLLSRLPPGSVPGLRPQTGDDQAFIRELFVSRRWAEVSAVPGWDDAQRRSFLYSQAELQRKHYEQHYPAAGFLIVEHAGNPIGRLCMHCSATNLHIVDLALLPVWCGQGIGSRLLGHPYAHRHTGANLSSGRRVPPSQLAILDVRARSPQGGSRH